MRSLMPLRATLVAASLCASASRVWRAVDRTLAGAVRRMPRLPSSTIVGVRLVLRRGASTASRALSGPMNDWSDLTARTRTSAASVPTVASCRMATAGGETHACGHRYRGARIRPVPSTDLGCGHQPLQRQ